MSELIDAAELVGRWHPENMSESEKIKMTQERDKKRPPAHLLDMDGVLVRGGEAVDKSADYIQILIEEDVPFIVFSNNSRFTPEVMATRLQDVWFPHNT